MLIGLFIRDVDFGFDVENASGYNGRSCQPSIFRPSAMASLTFECPKCNKQFKNVKTEMIGYRVRCTCGFEFRLGEKQNRKPGVDKKINQSRKKREVIPEVDAFQSPNQIPAQPQRQAKFPPVDKLPVPESFPELTELPDALVDDANALPVAELIDENPAAPWAGQTPVAPPVTDPFAYDPLAVDSMNIPAGQVQAPVPLSPYAAPGAQRPRGRSRKRKKRRSEEYLESSAGPIATFIVGGLSLLLCGYGLYEGWSRVAMIFDMIGSVGSLLPANAWLNICVYLLSYLLMVGLFGCIIWVIAVAVMELSEQIEKRFASKVTAIVAGVLAGALFLVFILAMVQLSNIDNVFYVNNNVVRSAKGQAILRFAINVAPAIAMLVLGLVRNTRR